MTNVDDLLPFMLSVGNAMIDVEDIAYITKDTEQKKPCIFFAFKRCQTPLSVYFESAKERDDCYRDVKEFMGFGEENIRS